MMRRFLLLPIALIFACSTPQEKPLQIRVSPEVQSESAKRIESETAITLAPGLQATLWASDSLAPDPIAMSIDDKGRIYLTSTDRQKHSEFDIRGHQDWMISSISFQTVEDRRNFLRKTFDPARSKENEWLEDLNGDGVHDWHDLTVEQDEVWQLVDENGDGRADVSTRVVRDFHEEITDVAEGLLVREKDMFIGIGPDLWRLMDENGDGIPERKESISHGWAVHIGFGGHGMSGIVEGPDGKIYWGIGDIGANLVDKDGNKHEYPNEGIIVRCNPDGSEFEVFAMGLRNTHEFVFDELGNLITSDNDGDHAGESERLLHVVEGADIGWRANWQYGKYTDPRNNGYNVWMDEKLYIPRHEGQAAYILPPIMNYHNGPTGMVYNPGTALGPEWKDRFFLVEFTGTTTRSHIWSFSLQPQGASYVLKDEIDMVGGLLPTGIRFGPDGALYAADWITGWGTKDYGRVWKIDVTDAKNEWKGQRAETQRLMQLNYGDQKIELLKDLLRNADMRIRQKAQFELVKRGDEGHAVLKSVAEKESNRLARVHAIWGLGQLKDGKTISALLSDADDEIRVQAAKVVGDIRHTEAAGLLRPMLEAANPRLAFYAAQAIGRLRDKASVPALLSMLDRNNDQDHYLRHAAVLALARIGAEKEAAALASNPKKHLRVAGVLVLRRLRSPMLAQFLADEDEYIVTEAARAIHDDKSVEKAMPALAGLLKDRRFKGEPLLRRAISACQRVGGEEQLRWLVDFAGDATVSVALRAESMAALGTWANPSEVDRVDGWYRGVVRRDPAGVRNAVRPQASGWLKTREPELVLAVARMIRELELTEFSVQMDELVRKHVSPEVRAGILPLLSQLKYAEMESLLETALRDKEANVRKSAISLLHTIAPDKARLAAIARPVMEKGSVAEQQQLLRTLAAMPATRTQSLLEDIAARLVAGKLDDGILLEFYNAADSSDSPQLKEAVAKLRSKNNELLVGGDAGSGEGYFFWNPTGQCVRCHTMGTEGGKVGPPLTTIGETLSRSQILEALLNPDARISPGYGNVTLKLTDGSTATGVLLAETAEKITLKTTQAEPLIVEKGRIKDRQNAPSGMPAIGKAMSRAELRDVVEYLATRRKK